MNYTNYFHNKVRELTHEEKASVQSGVSSDSKEIRIH